MTLRIPVLLLSLSACGARNTLSTEDFAETATLGLEESADALGEDGTASGGGAALSRISAALSSSTRRLASTNDFQKTRACDDSATGMATVTLTLSGSRSSSFETPSGSRASSFTLSGSETRTWTPVEGAPEVSCSSATGYAQIDWASAAQVNGLLLSISIDRNRESRLQLVRRGRTHEVSHSTSIQGDRNIEFVSSEVVGDELVIRKKTSSNVTRNRTIVNPSGEKTFEVVVATAAGAPLDVEVRRLVAAPATVTGKSIRSGTLNVTRREQRLELKFSDVVFDFETEGRRCIPKSGSISGAIYESGSETAASSFTVTFSESEDPVYESSDGESVDLNVDDGCDLALME